MAWPIEVTILDQSCNISSVYGNHTPGYPDDLQAWVQYELEKRTGPPSSYILGLRFWGAYHDINRWCDYCEKREQPSVQSLLPGIKTAYNNYITIITSEGVAHNIDNWNYRVRFKYNLTWAYLGYTDGQCEAVLKMLQYITKCPLFQKLKEMPPEPRTYYREPKQRAKKEVYVPKPKPKPTNQYSFSFKGYK